MSSKKKTARRKAKPPARRAAGSAAAARRRAIGRIGWADLSVPNADEVRDFYAAVVGWTAKPVDMGGYADYLVQPAGRGKAVAGVCHARGVNADLPPCWLIYVSVDSLERSLARCLERGGRVKVGPKSLGDMGRYCVIQDPAGAYLALREPPR